MPPELALALIAVTLGAVLQVGVGIGFSIIAGPVLMLQMGTGAAVPLLLLFNVLVSVVAAPGAIQVSERRVVAGAIVWCLVGIAAGSVVYPYLSETVVLATTGILLLIGAAATLVPVGHVNSRGLATISGLSGVATAWTATPGPLMAIGLILSEYSAGQVRKLVQPVALIAYGAAFVPHAIYGWRDIANTDGLWVLLAGTMIGSLAGRWIGASLPHRLITNTVRAISLAAGIVLLYRAVAP